MLYKTGDRVYIKSAILENSPAQLGMSGGNPKEKAHYVGREAVVTMVAHPTSRFVYHLDITDYRHDWSDDELAPYKPKQKTTMATLGNLFKKMTDGATQKLRQADLIDGDLELTSKGTQALLEVLFVEHKAELVKLAEEIIEERNKEKNK